MSELLKMVAWLNAKNYIYKSGYIWIYLFHEVYIFEFDVTTRVIFFCLPANEYISQGKAFLEDDRLHQRQ